MTNNSNSKRTAFLASLGAGLEYYDFIIYGMMAEYLATLFFHQTHSWIALAKTFLVFSLGYFIRPLGGILFGMIGDTYGRKKTFLAVMFLMAMATFAIGLLPVSSQFEMLAPSLLILFRLLQGLSFGAELPGAITVVCEHSSQTDRSSHSGIVVSSVSLGSILASVVLYIVTKGLSKAEILEWGWRIPFLLGGLLAFANYFIRKGIQESSEFLQNKEQGEGTSLLWRPLAQVFAHYKGAMVRGIGLTGIHASLVIFALFLPTFLNQNYKHEASDLYFAMTVGMIWSAISLPFCGRIADKIGRNLLLKITLITFILGVFPLFGILMLEKSLLALIAFNVLYQTFISFITVSYLPMLIQLFPARVRYTAVAICYNVTYALMAMAPMIWTMAIAFTAMPTMVVVGFLALMALLALLSVRLLGKELLSIV